MEYTGILMILYHRSHTDYFILAFTTKLSHTVHQPGVRLFETHSRHRAILNFIEKIAFSRPQFQVDEEFELLTHSVGLEGCKIVGGQQ